MRRLILLRHAKAERGIPGAPDRSRSLNDRGQRQACEMGAFLKHHGLVPGLAVVSPAERTRQTWALVSAEFTPAPPQNEQERLYNADIEAILGVIRETAVDVQTLMVVGHNPGLHEVALTLVATGDVEARQRLGEKLPTGGLVVIELKPAEWDEVHPRCGRLIHFVTPRQLTTGTD